MNVHIVKQGIFANGIYHSQTKDHLSKLAKKKINDHLLKTKKEDQ